MVLQTLIDVACAARTELTLFAVAFVLHHFLFGNLLRGIRRPFFGGGSKSAKKVEESSPYSEKQRAAQRSYNSNSTSQTRAGGGERQQRAGDHLGTSSAASPSENDDPQEVLDRSQAFFEKGDYRSVLRCWTFLKRYDGVLPSHLAQVVESMQRFKKDSDFIVTEIKGHLERHASQYDVEAMNELLEPLGRSLDTQVVAGLVGAFPSLGFEANAKTYDTLLTMHFATRGFSQVSAVSSEMEQKGVLATSHAKLVILKTALRVGDLDEALKWFRACIVENGDGSHHINASAGAAHITMQLVELGCREHRIVSVLDELDRGNVQFTGDLVNLLLAECAKEQDRELAVRVEKAVRANGKNLLNSRCYLSLIKLAGNDCDRIKTLLVELVEAGIALSVDLATAVLATAQQQKGVSPVSPAEGLQLAETLAELVMGSKSPSQPTISALIRFFSEAGSPARACELYDRLVEGDTESPQKAVGSLLGVCNSQEDSRATSTSRRLDSRTERCLMASALECGRKDLAESVVGITGADVTKHIATIRGCATRGNLDAAFGIFNMVQANGASETSLTPSLYNAVLDACVECKDLRRAEAWMETIKSNSLANKVSYNTMIKAHLRFEQFDKARALMEEMRLAGHAPNQVTYNEFVNAIAHRHGGPRHQQRGEAPRPELWSLIAEMQDAGVPPNRITCSILLGSLGKDSSESDVSRMMKLLNGMEEPMDEVLLSSSAEACIRVGRPELIGQMVQKLREAGDGRLPISGAHTFGSVIKAYGRAHDVEGAWSLWREMRLRHVRPTSITIGCMVEAVVSNGDPDGGYELIRQLHEDVQCRDQLNAVIYCSVMKGYARVHQMECVWTLWNEMLNHRIEPSIVTYNALIDACARNSNMDAVPDLLKGIETRGLTPNLITYSTTLKGLCQRGDVPAAFTVLDDMRRTTKLRPDEIMYNTLLDGCSLSGLTTEGERILEQMQAEGVTPSDFTLTIVVKLFSGAKRADRACDLVFEISRKHGIRPNHHVYANLVSALIRQGDLVRATTAFQAMAKDHRSIPAKTWQGLAKAHFASGDMEKLVDVLRVAVAKGSNTERPQLAAGERGDIHRMNTEDDDVFLNDMLESLNRNTRKDAKQATELLKELRTKASAPRPMTQKRIPPPAGASKNSHGGRVSNQNSHGGRDSNRREGYWQA